MAVVTDEMREVFDSKMSWAERQKLIEATFPSIESLSWQKAFKDDTTLFGEVLRGILKYDQTRKGKPGPRPTASRTDSTSRLIQFMGEDYSLDPIPKALSDLKGNLSLRGLTSKTGVNYNVIFKLLHGTQAPDITTMTQVAEAFNKHPSYFLEYRLHFVVAALVEKMKQWPESSVVSYRKLKGDEY